MSAEFYYTCNVLINGDVAPTSSNYIRTLKANKIAVCTYASGLVGNSILTLWYPSPFFVGMDVPFYSQILSGQGYADSLLITTPIDSIKVTISGGTGNFWVALTQNN